MQRMPVGLSLRVGGYQATRRPRSRSVTAGSVLRTSPTQVARRRVIDWSLLLLHRPPPVSRRFNSDGERVSAE